MRIFSFEKWFLDILTRDGQYIIVFHTLTRILGIKICYLDIQMGNHFNHHQKLHIKRRKDHTIETEEGNLTLDETGAQFKLRLKTGEFEIRLTPEGDQSFVQSGLLIPADSPRKLSWKPLHLKAEITGKLPMGDRNQALLGTGYTDYLFSNLSPFRIPVRQLYWGRLHHREVDLTYAYALDRNQQILGSWMLLRHHGTRTQLQHLKIHSVEWKTYDPPNLSCPLSFILDATGTIQLRLRVQHGEPGVISEFIDNLSGMGKLQQAIIRWLSRNPRGIKFFARGTIEITQGSDRHTLEEIPMINEYVRFI